MKRTRRNVSESLARPCACGCGEIIPPPEAGKKGRKRVFFRPRCQQIFREALLGGWTADSEVPARAFVLARRAGLRGRPEAAAISRPLVNPVACRCGCGRVAEWARGSCERDFRRRAAIPADGGLPEGGS